MSFEERVAWVINLIKERYSLNNVKLGKKLGVNKNTIQAYGKGKGELKGAAMAAIVKEFGISGEWLISGNGEPFPGARARYPDICTETTKVNEKPSHGYFTPPNHSAAAYIPAQSQSASGIDPFIQAMSDLKDIFVSGDPILIPAIQANLNAFKRALLREQQFTQIINENKELKETLGNVSAKLAELENKVSNLEKENSDLKRRLNNFNSHGPDGTPGSEDDGSNTERKAM